MYIYYINNKQLKTNKMENQMNIENQMLEMEAKGIEVLCDMQEADDYPESYYELDGLLNDMNFVDDDYEGEELDEAMLSLIDRVAFVIELIKKK